jgi:hypothetical protein
MMDRVRRAAVLQSLLASALAACVPGAGPCVLPSVRGRVLERATEAPIAGAVVFERWRGAGRMGGPQPTYHARFARSDAEGRFALERGLAPSPRMWVLRTYEPSYGFAHPHYGLVYTGEADPGEGGDLLLRGSEADAAVRRGDLASLCETAPSDGFERELAREVCPERAARPAPER